MNSFFVSCCWEGRIIIGNIHLCRACGLGGHCVNALHLPADCSLDWLLMTFLGQRHVKLFIYSKKKIPNANSPLHQISPLPLTVCRHFCLSVCLCLSDRDDHDVVISKVCDIRSGQLFFCLFVLLIYACVWVCVAANVPVRILCMWQIWDICDCRRESDTPLQACVFKKNLQQTPNHSLADHCHKKSLTVAAVMQFLTLDHETFTILLRLF